MDKDIRAEGVGQGAELSGQGAELSEADIAKLREYIRNCPECFETLRAELRLRQLIRRCCCPEEAPSTLAHRVSMQVRRAAQQVEYREYRTQTTVVHSTDSNGTSRVIMHRTEGSIVRYSDPESAPGD